MTNEEKAMCKGKKIEAIIGLIFLIPPVLGILSFILQLFDTDSGFSKLDMFEYTMWTGDYRDNGGYTSALPVFLGLMAIAGGWLLKGNLQYLFMPEDKSEERKSEARNKEEYYG